jgi:hypothetical protein
MPRILAACLALLLTANGWVALPASYIETGRDSYRSAYIGTQSVSKAPRNIQQPAAALPPSALVITRQAPQAIPEKILEYRSRPVDAPPAFRLGQRPPPQTA